MQEGTVAFLQMVKISAAIAAHKAAGLPYLVYLRHPTTGGVFASWGSLGHVTVAEPGALIGFLGPAGLRGAVRRSRSPTGVQTAENLFDTGLVDAVLAAGASSPDVLDRALNVLMAPRDGAVPEVADAGARGAGRRAGLGVDHCARAAGPARASAGCCATRRTGRRSPLNGTGEGEHDPGLMLALARFGGAPCVVLGQDRRGQTRDRADGPGGAARGPSRACGWPPSCGCRC